MSLKKAILFASWQIWIDSVEFRLNTKLFRLFTRVDVCGFIAHNEWHMQSLVSGVTIFTGMTDWHYNSYANVVENPTVKLGERRQEAVQDISMKKFFEQRIRYAYENLALPFRFILFALVIPILLTLFALNHVLLAVLLILFITVSVVIVSLVGQSIYGKNYIPWFTFLFSPLWFWLYPLTTWIAVFKYISGGVYFGGKKVKRPA